MSRHRDPSAARERVLAISKRKALETAQKYIQKGAFDKALKEYLKHLKAEPDDTNARLKLGDLHLKRGDSDAAIESYGQVASLFSKGGFDAKAVAIYKQILRIDPRNLGAHVSLGDHFQRLGLNKDALRELQEAVKICRESGHKRQAFDLLKRVSALDPTNVPNRLSLADLFLREGMRVEAKQEFESLLSEVEGASDGENLARVSQQMLEAFPDEERPYLTFASAQMKMGQPAEAIAKLCDVLPSFPDSIPMRDAVVELYEALGDAASAQSMHREIAELYKRHGDHDKAREILQRHVPIDVFGDDEDTSPSLILSEVASDTSPSGPSLGEELLELEPTSHSEPPQRPKPVPRAKPKAAKPAPAPEPSREDELAARAAGVPEYEELDDDSGFDSLPDIELVLEDEDTDTDDTYATIEPPAELERSETADGGSSSVTTEVTVEKLDQANRLFDRGGFDEAEQLYREIIGLSPNHPQAMLRLGEIEAQRGGEPTGLGEEEPEAADALIEDDAISIDDGLDMEFEIEDGLEEIDEPEIVEPPAPATEPAKPATEPKPAKSAPAAVEVDDAEEPESLIDADYFADVLKDDDEEPPSQDSFDLAAELGDEGGASQEDFQQVLDAFKKGVQEQLGDDESEAHYDLAIAYKEMGLLEDAIEQLDLVRRSGEMQIEVLSLMATCKMELGRPQEAAGHLSEALVASGDGDAAVAALRYELGEALIAAGKHGEALEAFHKVAALDGNFREVKQRIAGLGG